MAKNKFYAVRIGRVPGVYSTWDEAKAQVDGFKGAVHASFTTKEEATAFMEAEGNSKSSVLEYYDKQIDAGVAPGVNEKLSGGVVSEGNHSDEPYVFVDGSFNANTKTYGYGGFLRANGRSYPLIGSVSYNPDDPKNMAEMRNVAGEITGAMAAVKKAESLGLSDLKILYDYNGIKAWAERDWKTNKPGTQDYANFMRSLDRTVKVTFEHVDAHTGIEGNEMADVMAKYAVGIPLTKSQEALFDKAMRMGKRDGVSGVDIDVEADDLELNGIV